MSNHDEEIMSETDILVGIAKTVLTNADSLRQVVDNLDEDDAFTVLYAMRRKFRWAGTLFTVADVEDYVYQSLEAEDDDEPDPAEVAEVVEAVLCSYEWNKGLNDAEHGFDMIGVAVAEAIREVTQ